jgi:uncharacterized membrane protein HdeD (DUF308 family)
MNGLNSSLLRCLFAIALGVVLLLWPDLTAKYIVFFIGVCFIIPGLVSLVGYFIRPKTEGVSAPMFPLHGIGSILLGVWLCVMPDFFITFFLYLLGILLVIGGLQQLFFLNSCRKRAIVPFGFYIVPSLIFLIGMFIIIYPLETEISTFKLFGLTSIIYGISELINWFRFYRKLKVQIAEVIEDEEPDKIDEVKPE